MILFVDSHVKGEGFDVIDFHEVVIRKLFLKVNQKGPEAVSKQARRMRACLTSYASRLVLALETLMTPLVYRVLQLCVCPCNTPKVSGGAPRVQKLGSSLLRTLELYAVPSLTFSPDVILCG